jgi:hypothetical protein
MKDGLEVIVKFLWCVVIAFFLATYIYCGILPTTAIYAKEVKDSTGIYIVVNKRFKIVYEKTISVGDAKWHLYRDNKCLPVWSYACIHTTKFGLIMYIMGSYRFDYDDNPIYMPEF